MAHSECEWSEARMLHEQRSSAKAAATAALIKTAFSWKLVPVEGALAI